MLNVEIKKIKIRNQKKNLDCFAVDSKFLIKGTLNCNCV